MAVDHAGAAPPGVTAIPIEGDDLLALALSTPAAALDRAREVLAVGPGPLRASYAHQASAIVLRERGELGPAFVELRHARRLARAAGSVERIADVDGSLGVAEVMAGRTHAGLRRLERATTVAHGRAQARIRLLHAVALRDVGRYDDAFSTLRLAVVGARRFDDRLWEARILINRACTHLAVGALHRAEADVDAAEDLFERVGQRLEAADATFNRATIATLRGDLPQALRIFDIVEDRYRTLGHDEPALALDRGRVLLDAGLAGEAVAAAEDALARTASSVRRSELQLFGARAALAAGHADRAFGWSQEARREFRAQQRPGWELRARLMECQARYATGQRTAALLETTLEVARQLRDQRDDDAPLALLLAARLATGRGRHDEARECLETAAAYRRRGTPLGRATGWLAQAMLCAVSPAERGLLAACGRGLDALEEHRVLFGAAELRATASGHGTQLADLAVDAAIRRRSPRLMLTWAERSRALSLAEPAPRPEPDPELARELGAARDADRRLAEAVAAGGATAALRAQRDGWEAAVRRRRRHLSGESGTAARLDVAALHAALGEATLLELIQSGDRLHLLQVAHGRVSRREIGPVADAATELDFVLFGLRRAAYGGAARLEAAASRLERALLGSTPLHGPVVIAPPAAFHAVPWGLLPGLADAAITVAPSALVWQRAATAAARPHSRREVLLASGPGLGTRTAEIAALAPHHPAARRVVGAEATVERVLTEMSGAWIAHLAAHGDFRADAPLFSALRLHDGSLFVHDLDRLAAPPRQVILSACDSGVSAAVGMQELLGLVSGFLRAGTASVLASVVPVNDEAAVPVMVSVHRALGTGSTLAEALREARIGATDGVEAATAASFGVWGA